MQYRTLGKTGLRVSEIGLGANQIGRPEVTEQQAEAVLNTALDLGINFIDTAAMYKLSESRIGKYLANRHDEFIIATKCGDYSVPHGDGFRTVKDYSPEGVLKTIDESRQKLKRDCLDIVQFHGLPPEADARRAACDALLQARDRGWVRHVGLSLDTVLTAAEFEFFPIETQEFTYNIYEQESAADLLPNAARHGIGTIIKRPIANAVFMLPERPEGTYYVRSWDRAQQLDIRALADGMAPVEFALRFALSHPHVSTAIVGTTNIDNLAKNAAASDGQSLPDRTIAACRAAFQAASQH